MKLTNTILVLALACGTGWAQNGPAQSQGAKATADAAKQKQNSNVKAVPVSAAKPAATKPAATQSSTTAAKPTAVSAAKAPAIKPAVQPVKAVASPAAAKPTAVSVTKATTPAQPKAVAAKPEVKAVAVKPVAVKPVAAPPAKSAASKEATKAAEKKSPAKDASAANVSVEKAPEPAKNDRTKTYSANGRRDPFISPVVSQSAVGSGCSTGKRCLAVEQISLKGVVKSETGMIAVVVNALDKAYFLRENDPVFDGYVLKITTDSIVFKETVQDKLGKPFTKEVTKKLNTPAV